MKPIDRYIKSGRGTKMWKKGVKEANMTMIKIDYEGAWKELKELCKGTMYIDDEYMEILERSHTHNYIENGLGERLARLESDNIIFENEQYGEITLKQIIKELISTLGLRIETSRIPAKGEIKKFELKGNIKGGN